MTVELCCNQNKPPLRNNHFLVAGIYEVTQEHMWSFRYSSARALIWTHYSVPQIFLRPWLHVFTAVTQNQPPKPLSAPGLESLKDGRTWGAADERGALILHHRETHKHMDDAEFSLFLFNSSWPKVVKVSSLSKYTVEHLVLSDAFWVNYSLIRRECPWRVVDVGENGAQGVRNYTRRTCRQLGSWRRRESWHCLWQRQERWWRTERFL